MPKTALVFGHTSGLGLAVSRELMTKGYKIVGVARSKSSVESDDVVSLTADISKKFDIENVVNEITQKYATFDVLVYCSGTLTSHDMGSLDYDGMEYAYKVNTYAPMYIESRLLDLIKKNGSYVVNVTSSTLMINYPQFAEYASSKAALAKFTKDLHVELKDTGARVMDICPGGFASNIYTKMSGEKNERDESKQMDPANIAGLIAYIVELPKNVEVPFLFVNRK